MKNLIGVNAMKDQTGKFLFIFEDGTIALLDKLTEADKRACDDRYVQIIDLTSLDPDFEPSEYYDGSWRKIEPQGDIYE